MTHIAHAEAICDSHHAKNPIAVRALGKCKGSRSYRSHYRFACAQEAMYLMVSTILVISPLLKVGLLA